MVNKYNRRIIDTKHSIDKFIDQYSQYSHNDVNTMIHNAINKIVEVYNDESTVYGVWSKSTGICVIIDWEGEDYKNNNKLNHAIIVTLPPIKNSFNSFHTINKEDVKIIVERSIYSIIDKQYLLESNNNDSILEIDIEATKIYIYIYIY